MGKLIPVKYGIYDYPTYIRPQLVERAGHFDKGPLKPQQQAYSLHTEYSYGRRRLGESLIRKYDELYTRQIGGVPQLWYSNEWALQFADYIKEMIGDNLPPTVIEIHPPFNDYCNTIDLFLERYKLFEDKIKTYFPYAQILIENRFGSSARQQFLISKSIEIRALCHKVRECGLNLRVTLDLPQLLNAHGVFQSNSEEDMKVALRDIYRVRKDIIGIHLWGSEGSDKHVGDLNSLFNGNMALKAIFLDCIYKTFVEGDEVYRYFVPEVNPSSLKRGGTRRFNDPADRREVEGNIASIVGDLRKVGFEFF